MYADEVVFVKRIIYEDDSIQLLETSGGSGRALLYRNFFPSVQEGKNVIVNVTATLLHLGTGGWDIVKSVPDTLPYKEVTSNGHIMKARYMPNQHSVLSVEAQESEDHALFQSTFNLEGKPILLAELHSMIPLVYVLMKKIDPNVKLSVIISDEAALPLMLSEHMRILKTEKDFHSITVGQAFGGEFEAVNLITALQFAVQKLKSDIIMISLGPGVVGTGTVYGFSGMELANWANIVSSLNGQPVWVPRVSFKDRRERHHGISHHTITPLMKFTYTKSIVPLPYLANSHYHVLAEQADKLKEKHMVSWVEQKDFKPILEAALESYPKSITTMGRTYNDDPTFFYSVAAAVYTAYHINTLD
ncbi:hypothetical protein BTR23_01355 [Alkalihalophilus pseudofirmus]|nr:hypothetical protein BTR23_01355 [Alkalihalophilus pseudofirmus]